jgi:two-component system, NtrC family, response regulator AtoC
MSTVLVIEDDRAVRSNILDLLEAEGFTGIGAADGRQGVALAVQHLPDLVICDVGMPEIDGFEVFEILSAEPRTAALPFIFLSARAERGDVRRGMALGADDYLTKPFTRNELLDSIHVRLKRRRAGEPSLKPGEPVSSFGSLGEAHASPADGTAAGLVVGDRAMAALLDQVERLARGTISVLILGETGVGKERMAEEIHRRSARAGSFVALNCAALNESLLESELFGHEKGAFTGAQFAKEGLIETAQAGTLFLDEVGELPLSMQVKLLRVLEERKVMRVGGRAPRPVDIRVVSATNRDLEQEVEQGRFRADLFYRLNGGTLLVPALRERTGDIEPLAQRFVQGAARALARGSVPRISADVLAALFCYPFPGNIRELRNVLERAVLLCDGDTLLLSHLPSKFGSRADPRASTTVHGTQSASQGEVDPRSRLLREIEAMDRERVVDALARCAGNQTQAAALLGISRRTLVARLGQYELPRPRRRGP